MKNLYVLSAEQQGLHSTINKQHTKQLKRHITNLGATFLEGVDRQILVTLGDEAQQGALLELAALYQQDYILKVYPDREAYLLFTDGKETYFGPWTQ